MNGEAMNGEAMRRRAAIVGGGVIGGGWAARFLLNGWDVAVFDPDPQARRKIGEVLDNARRSLPALYDRPLPDEGRLSFHAELTEAVAGAAWVQESVPERLELKHKVLGAICAAAPEAVVGSSTSGFKPSELNAAGARAIVAHPFNPVYLLPLVELVGDFGILQRADEILQSVGMYPLHLHHEIDAHIADRFLEAVWREALWLVHDEIATTEVIDEAIRMGFGLRWAQMGLFETYRIAGGEAGMKHFMAQFGPALKWPWTKLMDVPEFTDELVELIAGQSDAQSGHMSIRELERLRDDNLVGMMRSLKRTGSGAGGVIATHEAGLAHPQVDDGALPVTFSGQVPQAWADEDGTMGTAHYLEAAGKASARFVQSVAGDAGTGRFVHAESHVATLCDTGAGERLKITTQLLDASGAALHLYHRVHRGDGEIAATVEMRLAYVAHGTGERCAPPDAVAAALTDLAAIQPRVACAPKL